MMNCAFDMTIKISPSSTGLVVEQEDGGVKSRKTLTLETFAECILGSRYDDDTHPTGFLPENCFAATLVGRDIVYFLRYPELCADISYYGTEYPDFPLPRLVFRFKYSPETGKVFGAGLAVVADERLSPDMPTYVYPFSNVHGDKQICLGNNALPVYKDPTRLHTLMRLILGFPNNDDMFRDTNNQLGLGYRDLLEHLKDKPSAYYYTDVLKTDGKTLRAFMSGR